MARGRDIWVLDDVPGIGSSNPSDTQARWDPFLSHPYRDMGSLRSSREQRCDRRYKTKDRPPGTSVSKEHLQRSVAKHALTLAILMLAVHALSGVLGAGCSSLANVAPTSAPAGTPRSPLALLSTLDYVPFRPNVKSIVLESGAAEPWQPSTYVGSY